VLPGVDFRALPVRTAPIAVPASFILSPEQLIPVAEMEDAWKKSREW